LVCAASAIIGVTAQQPGGRGGGPSPGAPLWAEQCAGCHGTGATAGRARNLFDEAWLNRVDDEWIRDTFREFPAVVTLDNHYVTLGQGVMLAAALARTGARTEVRSIGLTEIPVCGSNAEVLAHHRLDAAGIAATVLSCIHHKSFTG